MDVRRQTTERPAKFWTHSPTSRDTAVTTAARRKTRPSQRPGDPGAAQHRRIGAVDGEQQRDPAGRGEPCRHPAVGVHQVGSGGHFPPGRDAKRPPRPQQCAPTGGIPQSTGEAIVVGLACSRGSQRDVPGAPGPRRARIDLPAPRSARRPEPRCPAGARRAQERRAMHRRSRLANEGSWGSGRRPARLNP